MPDYSPIPTSALIGLAKLMLKRARLTLPVTDRAQAIRIIHGIKPAPSRKLPLNIKPHATTCCVCNRPIYVGDLCDSLGRRHATCELTSRV